MSSIKQNSIEWLMEKIQDQRESGETNLRTTLFYCEQAKQMHKDEMKECWNVAHQTGRFIGKGIAEKDFQTFEQYLNETFGGNNE